MSTVYVIIKHLLLITLTNQIKDRILYDFLSLSL